MLTMKKIIPFCLPLIIFVGSAGLSQAADFETGWEAFQNKDYATAMSEWKPLANKGNLEAQFWVGFLYERGMGVAEDRAAAISWYVTSAAREYAPSQRNLALLEAGKGNHKKALKLLTQASENGDHIASWKLAGNYRGTLQGWGVKKNLGEARYYEKLAAEQGNPGAQRLINAITPWWKFWAFYGWWRFW